jgi:hypothetical protein
VKNPPERITAREGINAAQAFFERHGCVFQEVAQQNDFGKDAYVDIGENGSVSFLCVAIQVKAGVSYRTAKGDYFIPIDDHAHNWRYSTVPIFGVVYDPDDQLMRWVDITGHLRANPQKQTGNVPVSREAFLTEANLRGAFTSALAEYTGRFGTIATNLLASGDVQTDAVYDAWALGRSDAKYLLIVRRFILDYEPRALQRAIHLLAHAGAHPDIFWTSNNWIPKSVSGLVTPSYRWSPEELAKMFKVIDVEDWGRGTLGQSLDVLLYEDPHIVAKLHMTIDLLIEEGETEQALRAASLALTHSKEQNEEVEKLIAAFPMLMDDEIFCDIYRMIQEGETLSLY